MRDTGIPAPQPASRIQAPVGSLPIRSSSSRTSSDPQFREARYACTMELYPDRTTAFLSIVRPGLAAATRYGPTAAFAQDAPRACGAVRKKPPKGTVRFVSLAGHWPADGNSSLRKPFYAIMQKDSSDAGHPKRLRPQWLGGRLARRRRTRK
jgi:hypothetical protein